MDSSCKYPVSPANAVLVSMDNLSLVKVPSDESIWPRRNCIAQTIEHLYQPESDVNLNDTEISSLVGFSESEHTLYVPSVVQNCDLANSSSYNKTTDCGFSCTDNSDDKSIPGSSTRECDGVPGELVQVRNSSFHPMVLRPKTVSPRHCIVTLYSEDEESSDSDYTVVLDVCDSFSSDRETDSCLEELNSFDEDSCDSEYATLAKGDEMALSTEESSDSDEDSAKCSSSDEEASFSTKHSSDHEDSYESSSSDEDGTVLRPRKPSDSDRLLPEDSDSSDEEFEASVEKLDNCNSDRATSEEDTPELSRDVQQNDSDSYVECFQQYYYLDSDSSFASNPTFFSEMDEEESTDDKLIGLEEYTEYSSEESDGSV